MGEFNLTNNMWQQYNNDDDDGDQQQGSQQQGKDPVRQQLKQLEKTNRELAEKLAKAEAAQRTTAIKETLTEKGLNPKLARLIPADVDATPEAIENWYKDHADLFPATKTPEPNNDGNNNDNSGDAGGNDGAGDGDQSYVDALNAMARINLASSNPTLPNTKPEDLFRKIVDPSLKPEELLKLIEQHGGGAGSG